jgi:hypothetical protein
VVIGRVAVVEEVVVAIVLVIESGKKRASRQTFQKLKIFSAQKGDNFNAKKCSFD